MINKIYSEKRKMIWPKVLIGLFVALAVFATISIVFFNSMIKTPNSNIDEKVDFVVEQGQGVETIAENLNKNELLARPFIFKVYLKYKGKASDLKAGHYDLNKNMNIVDLTDVLTGGKVKSSKITIVEGQRVEEVAKKLAEGDVVAEDQFLGVLDDEYDYDFLKDKPKDQTLEGYLFPDTYFLPADVAADKMVKKMLDNFSNKFTKDLEDAAKAQGFSIHQIITLSSLVEKEVSKKEDKELVAGVLKNRLKLGMPLQSDVTNHYIKGDWKKELTAEDLNSSSPYNTRKVKGLPPGPICSPGLESIKAAIYHKESDYLYYLSDKDGVTHFAYTKEEHDQNKAKYLD